MKKIITIVLGLLCSAANAQTFPVNNLTVAGTLGVTGQANFTLSPTGPTPSPGDSSTKFATTAFVSGLAPLLNPVFLGAVTSTGSFVMTGATSTSRIFHFQTAGVERWQVLTDNTAETGSNAGSNFDINSYTDAGAYLSTPMTIIRSTGVVNFASAPLAPTVAQGSNNTQTATTGFVAAHSPCPSILDNGGNNTGSSDNTAAFAATAALGPSGQACVYFPPGTYAFSGNVAYTMPTNTASITVLGAGQDVSKLVWAGGGGMTINFITDANSVHVRNLTFATGTTATGTALALTQTAANTNFSVNTILSDVSNVAFRGNDGYQVTDYWANDIAVFGISNVNFISDAFIGASGVLGNGVFISGDANRIPVQFNLFSCVFSGHSNGFVYGTYTQGVTIGQSNFTNVGTGIVATGGETGLDQLTVIGNQFNATSVAINLITSLIDTMIHGNLFLIRTSGVGIQIAAANATSIVGNRFGNAGSATSTTGISMTGYSVLSTVITGNSFSQLTTGVNLTSSSQSVNVQSNTYAVMTNNVINNCTIGCTVGGGSQ